MRNPYQSPAIEQGLGQRTFQNSLQENVEFFHKDKVIKNCLVHYLKENVPSSSELRKCLSLAFGK